MKNIPVLRCMFCLLPVLAASALLAACAEHPVQTQAMTQAPAPSSISAQSSTKTDAVTEPLTISGMLTLKGSDANLWLALSDVNGKVWRLESDDKNRLVQLREWQNRRVKVQGTKLTPFLNIDRLQIDRINLE